MRDSSSSNDRTTSRCGRSAPARTTPIVAIAVRPESGSRRSESASVPALTPSSSSVISVGEGSRLSRTTPRTTRTPTSPSAAPPISREGTQRNGSAWRPERANCSTTTARIAPSGSISTPSPSSTARTWSLSRTERTSGPITVGPVTETSAPNMNAVPQGSTPSRPASNVPTRNVVKSPTVSRLRTTAPTRRRNCTSIANAPSKTSRPTSTSRASGKISCRSSVLNRPRTDGPATTPRIR